MRIATATEGSSANSELGFPSSGESAEPTAAVPAGVSGLALNPISVINPTSASITGGNPNIPSFGATGFNMANKTLSITVDGVSPANIVTTFSTTTSLPAITSAFSSPSAEIIAGDGDGISPTEQFPIPTITQTATNGNDILRLNWDDGTSPSHSISVNLYDDPAPDTVNSVPVKILTTDQIIVIIQNAIDSVSSTLVVDKFNNRLRIRGKDGVGVISLSIDKTINNSAHEVLGFNNIAAAPEVIFQNDQLLEDANTITADIYINEFTIADASAQINLESETVISNAIASVNNGRLVITSPTIGSTSQVEITASEGVGSPTTTAAADLVLIVG